MVPACSHKVPRVSWYSGYRHVCFPFMYGAFTLSGWLSQNHSTRIAESIMRSEPRSARTPVWPLSISLAATLEIEFSFFSSPYLDVSVQAVPLHTLWIGVWMHEVCSCGFPHSDICGSVDNKRRHQILLMTPNDFHTPLDCSSLHLLFYIHSSFVYRNDVLDKSPFIRSSLSALFCTLSLVSIPECLFFHQVKPDDLCLVAPCQWLMFPLDCTSLH